MKGKLAHLVIILGIVMLLIPNGSSATPRDKIVCIGDSITAGEPTVKAWETYPYVLADLAGTMVINKGVSGQITAQMLARFEPDVINETPGTVVIMGGVNDIIHGHDPNEIIENLSAMYSLAESSGIRIVACTILPDDSFNSSENSIRQEVNDWIRSQASSTRIVADTDLAMRNPYNTGLLEHSYDSGDGLHPNAAGMSMIAQTIHNALDPSSEMQRSGTIDFAFIGALVLIAVAILFIVLRLRNK